MNKHKINFLISCVMGLAFGLIMAILVLFVDRNLLHLAAVSGLMFGLLMFLAITVCVGMTERKLHAMERKISQTVIFRANGVMQLEGKALLAWLCFCERSLFLLSVDVKPYICEEIAYTEIKNWEQVSSGAVVLHRTDGTDIRFQVPAEEFLRNLEEAALR